MKAGTDRILTTHVGSLHRPRRLLDIIYAAQDGKNVDNSLECVLPQAVKDVVRQQLDAGVDIVSDGELGKPGFVNYVRDRLSGFAGDSGEVWESRDLALAPEHAQWLFDKEAVARTRFQYCVDDVRYVGHARLQRDINNFLSALGGAPSAAAFLSAASPGIIAATFANRHYASLEEYLEELAEAMREEYQMILDAGFLLQIDAPDVPSVSHMDFGWEADVNRLGVSRTRHLLIDAIEYAIRDLDTARIRLHLCWCNYAGPHHLDAPLAEVLPVAMRCGVGAISFEAANPRHEHEWEIFEDFNLPDDKIIIPGLIDTVSTFVEHPQLVAQRIGRYVELVGRDRVMAGTDCGFGTFAGFGPVPSSVAFMKLRSLVEGCHIASNRWRGTP